MPGLRVLCGFAWVVLVLGAACGAPVRTQPPSPTSTLPPPHVRKVPLATATAFGRASPTATWTSVAAVSAPTPTPSPMTNATAAYILWVRYDALNRRLLVREEGRYRNTTGHPVAKLPLVAPMFTRAFVSLQEVTVNEQPVTYVWDWENWTVWFPLADELAPQAELTFRLDYVLTLRQLRVQPEDNTHPMVLGYTPLQANGVDIFFFVPHYDAHRGWLLPRYWPFGEFITFPAADFTLYLDVPRGWTIAANGQPIPCPEAANAADACFFLPQGRGSAFSVSTVYTTFTRQVDSQRGTPITLEAYLFEGDKAQGPYVLDVMEQALHLFEHWFGPYHRERLVFVVGDFPFSLEYDGLFFVRRSFFFDDPQYRLTAITVHETAHQWWFAQVQNDPALAPWMDEGLCTYAEVLYYQTYLPDQLAWWWDAYWEGLQPAQGPIDRPLWEYARYFDYRAAAYLKAAQFWKAVHETLGDARFAALLHEYAARYRGQVVPPENLALLVREYVGEEAWQRLRGEYFSSPSR